MTAPATVAEVIVTAADRLARLTDTGDRYLLHINTSNRYHLPPTIDVQVASSAFGEDDRITVVDSLSGSLRFQSAPVFQGDYVCGSYRVEEIIDGIKWVVWCPVSIKRVAAERNRVARVDGAA